MTAQNSPLDPCLFAALRCPDTAVALAGLLAKPPTAHLDDEDIAAVLERTPRLEALAHALSCEECEARIRQVEPLLQLATFPDPAPRPVTPLLRARPLFATVARARHGLALRAHSGVRLNQPAVAVRHGTSLDAIALRDHAADAMWELQLTPEGRHGRVRAHARWLRKPPGPRWFRAVEGSRTLGEAPFRNGVATLPDLRLRDLRLEAVDETPLAVAWIAVEAE